MTASDLAALSPLITIALMVLAVMLAIAFYRHHLVTFILTLAGITLAFLMLPVAAAQAPRQVTALLILDRYALFYMGLLLIASFVVALLSYGYLDRHEGAREEFYLLLLLATLGGAALVASSHFAAVFLGLETLSVALYVLIAYPRTRARSIEAGIKYLILAAASAAFMLFGMALVYAETGTMEFARLAGVLAGGGARQGLLLTGQAMIFIGVGFKLAVAPFHVWAPDVYEGAPAPVTAFIATLSKGAMFALLLRYFTGLGDQAYQSFFLVVAVIAIASMFVGNLLALVQTNVKRLLACSSIAHLGYLLVAFLAGGSLGSTAAAFYLAAYFVTILGAFGVIAALSRRERDADSLDDYRGLFWRRPGLASVFSAALLSLSGIPLTAGFMGKLYVLIAGVRSALWLMVVALAVNTVIGFYYYLRIAFNMFRDVPAEEVSLTAPSLSLAGSVALVALTLSLVWVGVYPSPLIHTIQSAVAGVVP
jgi:NADH-quinone oxidoreductase subunit N